MRAHRTLRIALAVCCLLSLAALANAGALPAVDITRSGIAAMLTWTHVDPTAARYELWRSDDRPYALPGTAGATLVGQPTPGALDASLTVTDADAGLGDPKRNSFYVVRGVTASGTPSPPSDRVGEFDFRLGGGCTLFPSDNVWNTRVDTLPADPKSAAYVASISTTAGMHADFGSGTWAGGPIGIPYTTVPGTQPAVSVTFDYSDESDPGPYPIPADAPVEGGPNSTGDRHVLVLDSDDCVLYELYDAWPQPDGSWQAGSGAIFNLRSHALRSYDQSRPALHRAAHPPRIRLAGTALRIVADRRQPAPDGPAFPAACRFRHLGLLTDQPDHPSSVETLRHVPGRQRVKLVSLGRA